MQKPSLHMWTCVHAFAHWQLSTTAAIQLATNMPHLLCGSESNAMEVDRANNWPRRHWSVAVMSLLLNRWAYHFAHVSSCIELEHSIK